MNVDTYYNSNSSSLDAEEDDDIFYLLMFVENKNNYIPKELTNGGLVEWVRFVHFVHYS